MPGSSSSELALRGKAEPMVVHRLLGPLAEPQSVVNIPPTLHGLLLSRVYKLPAEAQRLLQEAAVMVFDEATASWMLN